jgi:hypothetical protein
MQREITMRVKAHVEGVPERVDAAQVEQANSLLSAFADLVEDQIEAVTGARASEVRSESAGKSSVKREPLRLFTFAFRAQIPGDTGEPAAEGAVRTYLDKLGDQVAALAGVRKGIEFESRPAA